MIIGGHIQNKEETKSDKKRWNQVYIFGDIY